MAKARFSRLFGYSVAIMTTMKEIAEQTGVSISTVSLVLNGRDEGRVNPALAKLVRNKATELGYKINPLARSLRTNKTRILGFISEEVATTPYAGGIILGAQDAASAYGYMLFTVSTDGGIVPVRNPDPVSLRELVDYEIQRKVIIDNTKALLCGKPAANILLTGDAGTGKSSTVKAVCNELYSQGLRIIEIRKDQLCLIPGLLDELNGNPLKFILFIDDLSFQKDDDNFNILKAVLEGSVSAKSKNVVIYATSNRRHIVKEKFSDREGDDVHRSDTMQELVSLSERFGIHVTFSRPDKKTFLHIVRHLADEDGLSLSDGELELKAERFALERGGRSARLARQFVDGLLSCRE